MLQHRLCVTSLIFGLIKLYIYIYKFQYMDLFKLWLLFLAADKLFLTGQVITEISRIVINLRSCR